MLRIGEFSRYSRISIRMLRHYDAEGVLVPAVQDAATGYRLYAVEQLADANRIKALRDLGFLVRDIKRLLQADDDDVARELQERRRALDEEEAILARRRASLESLLEAVEAGDAHLAYEVQLVSVPAYDVVSLRMELHDYDEERLAWERLGKLMHERAIEPSRPYTEFCTFPQAPAHSEDAVVVEVSVATSMHGVDEGGLRFHRSDPLPEAASIMVYGPYDRIADAHAACAGWLEDHPSVRPAGDVREIVHRGCWNADDPSDYLTELIVPIERF